MTLDPCGPLRLGSAAALVSSLTLRAAAGWMDGWIISLSPLFLILLLQEMMMMMHSFITAPERHFLGGFCGLGPVYLVPCMRAGSSFVLAAAVCWRSSALRNCCCCERCEEIYTSARTDFDGTRCMVIVIRCERRDQRIACLRVAVRVYS